MPQEPAKPAPSHSQAPKNGQAAPADPELQNEGEGSRSGARRYDAEAERAASEPERVKELAKKAKDALDGKEAEELRAAEERGKKATHR